MFRNPSHSRSAPEHGLRTMGRRRESERNSVHSTDLRGSAIKFTIIGLSVLTLGLALAGTYSFLREDMLQAALFRQAQMQNAYEDRIAALRTQVDLVTSRQMLDQQAVESKVETLLQRQQQLGLRQQKVGDVFSQATAAGLAPVTQPRPRVARSSGLRLGSLIGTQQPFGSDQINDELFINLETSLEETERAQISELEQMRSAANRKAHKLAKILSKQGLRVPEMSAIGGPLIQLKGGSRFDTSIQALNTSLEMLETVRRVAKSLPHGSPTPGQRISSRYGSRRDPFTGSRAMHGGLDFKAKRGTRVRATASGTIIKAGRMGGYGKLIEIDHGGGITTRYAHLSKIHVKIGQKITRGKVIGRVGSTGRSTGPHLHYEVRRKGRALNPIHYVRLEKHLKPLL